MMGRLLLAVGAVAAVGLVVYKVLKHDPFEGDCDCGHDACDYEFKKPEEAETTAKEEEVTNETANAESSEEVKEDS